MSLFSRTSLIVKAKLSRLLDRAENPDETLDYSYERQLQLLRNVKRGVADVATAQKRLELQHAPLEQSIVRLDSQARQAFTLGREDLARAALERKSAAQLQLSSLDEQIGQLETQRDQLVESQKNLQARIDRFRSEKEVLKAQYSAAKAHVAIQEAATGIGKEFGDVGLAIDRARDKTLGMMARANAIEELTAAGSIEDFARQGDALDDELAQLASAAEVDSELARLRQQLGGSVRPELTAGADGS